MIFDGDNIDITKKSKSKEKKLKKEVLTESCKSLKRQRKNEDDSDEENDAAK